MISIQKGDDRLFSLVDALHTGIFEAPEILEQDSEEIQTDIPKKSEDLETKVTPKKKSKEKAVLTKKVVKVKPIAAPNSFYTQQFDRFKAFVKAYTSQDLLKGDYEDKPMVGVVEKEEKDSTGTANVREAMTYQELRTFYSSSRMNQIAGTETNHISTNMKEKQAHWSLFGFNQVLSFLYYDYAFS